MQNIGYKHQLHEDRCSTVVHHTTLLLLSAKTHSERLYRQAHMRDHRISLAAWTHVAAFKDKLPFLRLLSRLASACKLFTDAEHNSSSVLFIASSMYYCRCVTACVAAIPRSTTAIYKHGSARILMRPMLLT